MQEVTPERQEGCDPPSASVGEKINLMNHMNKTQSKSMLILKISWIQDDVEPQNKV